MVVEEIHAHTVGFPVAVVDGLADGIREHLPQLCEDVAVQHGGSMLQEVVPARGVAMS